MEKVTQLEALLFAAVLENCVDQLEILGYIMPVSDEDKIDLSHTGIQEMKEIIETQKEPDINDPELMSARQESEETVTSMALKNTEPEQQTGKTDDGKSTHQPSKMGRKQSALTVEKLRKIEADRQYTSDVITVTMKKMQESGIFDSLTEANEREKEKKSKFYDVLIREEEGKKEIKSLQKQLQDVKRQTAKDLQNRDKIIDRLKDKLQEKTAKLDTEGSYMKKDTDLQIHQTQKKCSKEENALNNEIQNLKNKTDEEIQLHTETENFLRQEYQKVEEKLEYWMQKYENDTDAKEVELDDLRALKAENLETMQKFAKECLMFEENIIIDRTEKKNRKKQREQDALELKSALKVQAWWRGTMVRRFLGPYQELEKLLKEQPAVQTETGKEKSGGKKK
ncbi:dynein regulatory complex protein 9 [Neopelma chrysocephalum]|uniref:dynein regulatory complex protein 9 n=1 Tax=Neopelma chrysocephalum TaxID=114329 RepID=UPI000FCD449F|nr:dynein regulatory complex protein 9 [Neopelma chrysocephalum]XP_027541583.1 dynein regulatory complex protein 9 [Neopelma chrysocephalum]